MEYLVLNSYIEFKQSAQKGWGKQFKSLGTFKIILLIIILGSAVFALVFLFIQSKFSPIIVFISTIIEGLCALLLSNALTKEDVLRSKERMQQRDEKYDEIKNWLKDIGYKEKNQIKQLCHRCETEMSKNNEKVMQHIAFIDKIFSFFLVPLYVAIIYWAFGLRDITSNQIIIVFTVVMVIISLYILTYVYLTTIQPILDSRYVKMNAMINDIHGVLDRKFTIEDGDIA